MTIQAKERIRTVSAVYAPGEVFALGEAEEERLVSTGAAAYLSAPQKTSDSFARAKRALQAALDGMKKDELLAYAQALGASVLASQTVKELRAAAIGEAMTSGVDFEALPDAALNVFGRELGLSGADREELLDAIEGALT